MRSGVVTGCFMRNRLSSRRLLPLLMLAAVAWASDDAIAARPTEQVLYRFAGGEDGADPVAGLVADSGGNLYGTTFAGGGSGCGGAGCGTAFELSPKDGGGWSETVLTEFVGGNDGAEPVAGLIMDSEGNLYGTTSQGGGTGCQGSGCGIVFALTPDNVGWKRIDLYHFKGNPALEGKGDVASPNGLVFAGNGDLYGFGLQGGWCVTQGHLSRCSGGAFTLRSPSKAEGKWKETVIYRFKGLTALSQPQGAPVFDADGNLYGLAENPNYGSVFALQPPSGTGAWTEHRLYTFQGGNDGGYTAPGLVFDADGNLYGATEGYVPASVPGSVFELTPAKKGKWDETTLATFAGTSGGDDLPAGPALGTGGLVYGTAEAGGANNLGVVYELSAPALRAKRSGGGVEHRDAVRDGGGTWSETVLYSFAGGSDGANPDAALLVSNGTLYGTTTSGGTGCSSGCGTVFAVVP